MQVQLLKFQFIGKNLRAHWFKSVQVQLLKFQYSGKNLQARWFKFHCFKFHTVARIKCNYSFESIHYIGQNLQE